MKKQIKLSLVTAAVLLAASTSVLAGHNYKGEGYKGEAMPAPCPVPLTIKDGFYLGAQLGYDSYRARRNSTMNFATFSSSSNPVTNAAGFVGGLMGGYGQYFNEMYYLGGEIFVNTSGASQSSTASSTDATTTASVYSKVSVGTSYGISLLPGVKLNDASLLYVRLGYNRARIKGQGTATVGTTSVAYSNNNWSSGFNYGLGIESSFYPNWSVRGEYTHTNYNSFSANATSGANSASTSLSPSDNQFMLGLIYHFA